MVAISSSSARRPDSLGHPVGAVLMSSTRPPGALEAHPWEWPFIEASRSTGTIAAHVVDRWSARPVTGQDEAVPRLPSLRRPPIGFAHRGARAHAPENTLEAFVLALRLGASGLESDVWLSADGIAVLDHDGVVGPRLRRRAIATVARAELPAHIPTLEQLYESVGSDFELSLDVKDAGAAAEVIAVARSAGAEDRLWLCHPELETVAAWRELSDEVKLVDSTRLKRIGEGPERRAARQRSLGVDAVNMHHADWNGGLIALFHRFERYTLGWDAQLPRILDELLDAGIDGVFSDHVDRMADAISRLQP
jgi:glycerophosphoryl diester phosphodiesterase